MVSVATIKDIARITGVSTATVSNVLNGKHGAAGQAKAREIEEVAKGLHYQPNALAKSLKQKRTHNIGIITEDLTVFNTPEIVDGIDAYCGENGYEIILANMRLFKRYDNDYTDTPKHRQLFDTVVRNMVAKQVEGIIYIGYHCREISYLPTMTDIPFVYAYCYPAQPLYPAVLFDDEGAAFDAANVLLDKGHRRIGVLSGLQTSKNAQARLQGFQRALRERGIPYEAQTTQYGDWSRKSGYDLAENLLAHNVTAIFAFNDLMASGVYMRCNERGLRVGRDISLFGYDNVDVSENYRPAISTVEAPLHGMGEKSAELVLAQLRKRKVDCSPLLLPCKLVVRGSVGACGKPDL